MRLRQNIFNLYFCKNLNFFLIFRNFRTFRIKFELVFVLLELFWNSHFRFHTISGGSGNAALSSPGEEFWNGGVCGWWEEIDDIFALKMLKASNCNENAIFKTFEIAQLKSVWMAFHLIISIDRVLPTEIVFVMKAIQIAIDWTRRT